MKELIGLSGIALGALGGFVVNVSPEIGFAFFGVGMTMWLGAAIFAGFTE